MDKKKLFIIIGSVGAILIILLLIIVFMKDENPIVPPTIGGDTLKIVSEDIKKDNEKGIELVNLNAEFNTKNAEKTKEFTYEFNLNGKRCHLKFANAYLNNSPKTAKFIFYINEHEINVMDVVKSATVQSPTAIKPKFYILGSKEDEVLVLEVKTIDNENTSIIYIAINENGEIRNSFGGYANNKVSEQEQINAMKNGNLIYDHLISLSDKDSYCDCSNKNKKGWLNKVISETKTFSVLEASLKLDKDDLYECNNYCK